MNGFEIVRINPNTYKEHVSDIIDSIDGYRDFTYETFEQCINTTWIAVNSYDYIFAMLCLRRISFDDIDFKEIVRLNPNYLYRIELFYSFMHDSADKVFFKNHPNEYHVLYKLLNEAMKFVDLNVVITLETRFCTDEMLNVLKNNKFKRVRMNDKEATFMRY